MLETHMPLSKKSVANLRAAMDRLVDGTAEVSDGSQFHLKALSIESGVGRTTLHKDDAEGLRDEWEKRLESAGKDIRAVGNVHLREHLYRKRLEAVKSECAQLAAENGRLAHQVYLLAVALREATLTEEEAGSPDAVINFVQRVRKSGPATK
jgi:hypothetical protein